MPLGKNDKMQFRKIELDKLKKWKSRFIRFLYMKLSRS